MEKRVVIGIVSKHYANYKNERTDTFIRDEIKQAIFDNGAIAVGILPKLDKVAFCEDGYADVIESKDKKFYIGVRFHPESLYTIDENMNNIFKKFIEVCNKNL